MEKRLQLWSPVWGWLATKEGESVDLKGQDLVLYETAIQEALEQEKLYYRKKSAPFNLMDYYDADDSVKEKVQNLDIQVKKEQDGLYVCASLALIEPLTQQELEAIQNFLSRQYEGGIFDTSRIRTYSVEEGEVVFDFSVDTKEKFSQKEVQCIIQMLCLQSRFVIRFTFIPERFRDRVECRLVQTEEQCFFFPVVSTAR